MILQRIPYLFTTQCNVWHGTNNASANVRYESSRVETATNDINFSVAFGDNGCEQALLNLEERIDERNRQLIELEELFTTTERQVNLLLNEVNGLRNDRTASISQLDQVSSSAISKS